MVERSELEQNCDKEMLIAHHLVSPNNMVILLVGWWAKLAKLSLVHLERQSKLSSYLSVRRARSTPLSVQYSAASLQANFTSSDAGFHSGVLPRLVSKPMA